MHLPQILYAYSLIPQVGPATLRRLAELTIDSEKIWDLTQDELIRIQIKPSIVEFILKQRSSIDPVKAWQELVDNQIKVTTINDPDYPALLKEIHSFPPLLTYQGALPTKPCVAIVGTRRPTNYGLQIAQQFAGELSHYGLTIVSGLAQGIDTAAHASVIKENKQTVAVLGTGLSKDAINQSEKLKLVNQIIETRGSVLSEFPFSMPGHPANFPRRNRILSGLCLATIVIEGDLKSGAMITARYALEQNREVLAVPGPINSPQSLGPNLLIKNGAAPALDINDILTAIGQIADKTMPLIKPFRALPELSADAGRLYEIISQNGEIELDQLLNNQQLSAQQAAIAITELELEGLIDKEGTIIKKI